MDGLEIFLNILAVVGSVLLLFGFYRVNTGKWSNKSFWYELDNAVGAIFIMAYQFYYHAYISVFVNVIWLAVAIAGLSVFFRRLRRHRKKRRSA